MAQINVNGQTLTVEADENTPHLWVLREQLRPARDYLARKRSEGHSCKEARRAHKTLLGRRIIRRMWADRRRQLDQSHQKAA